MGCRRQRHGLSFLRLWLQSHVRARLSCFSCSILTRCRYSKGGWLGHVHTAIMELQPGTTYSYRVGDGDGGWSAVFTYNSLPADVGSLDRPLRLLQVADMAYDNASDHTVRRTPPRHLSLHGDACNRL